MIAVAVVAVLMGLITWVMELPRKNRQFVIDFVIPTLLMATFLIFIGGVAEVLGPSRKRTKPRHRLPTKPDPPLPEF